MLHAVHTTSGHEMEARDAYCPRSPQHEAADVLLEDDG